MIKGKGNKYMWKYYIGITDETKGLSSAVLKELPSLSSMRDIITRIRTRNIGSFNVEYNNFP